MKMIRTLSDVLLERIVPRASARAEPGCCCGGRCDYTGGPPRWNYCCVSGTGYKCHCSTFDCR